jgi:hypothetical protein
MRIAVLLTTTPEQAALMLQRLRGRHPGSQFIAFVRDEDRAPLRKALQGCDVRRDKPAGGRLRFLRALRREAFDLLVVAWTGGERWQPLRAAALFAGARQLLVVDERGREWPVRWYLPWTWAGHSLRRLAAIKGIALVRAAAAAYRATLGLGFATLSLLLFALLRPLRLLRLGRPGRSA